MYILFWVRILFLCILCFTLTRSASIYVYFQVIQLFPTLCDPMDCSPYESINFISVSTIFAISFFSPPLFRTPFSYIFSEASTEDKICYHTSGNHTEHGIHCAHIACILILLSMITCICFYLWVGCSWVSHQLSKIGRRWDHVI